MLKTKPQVFCMTYAGGTAAFFDGIEKDLPGAEWVKLEYPGHGQRSREKLCGSFDELAEDQLQRIRAAYAGGDYALFGYSMGCITLVEVLRRILAGGLTLPKAVFLAAHEPRSRSELQGFTQDELDEWVKARTLKFGGIPEKLRNNRTFWRMYLPLYRGDYAIIGKYDFEALNLRTDVPAVVFYSETDTPLERMRLWEEYFTGGVAFHRLEGNHFFIAEHHRRMAEIMAAVLGVMQ